MKVIQTSKETFMKSDFEISPFNVHIQTQVVKTEKKYTPLPTKSLMFFFLIKIFINKIFAPLFLHHQREICFVSILLSMLSREYKHCRK